MVACGDEPPQPPPPEPAAREIQAMASVRPEVYAEVPLVADLSHLSDAQRQMIVLLIEASQIMDELFWRQSFGDGYQDWLAKIGVDATRNFAELNYGPWDRLDDERPFIEDAGP